MGKKIWLTMNSGKFGSDKIVRTYIRPPLLVSWSETLHFNYPARFRGKSHLRERKKNNNKVDSLYSVKVRTGHTIGFHGIQKLELNYRSS